MNRKEEKIRRIAELTALQRKHINKIKAISKLKESKSPIIKKKRFSRALKCAIYIRSLEIQKHVIATQQYPLKGGTALVGEAKEEMIVK